MSRLLHGCEFNSLLKHGFGKEFGRKTLPMATSGTLAQPFDIQRSDGYGEMLKKVAIKCDLCADTRIRPVSRLVQPVPHFASIQPASWLNRGYSSPAGAVNRRRKHHVSSHEANAASHTSAATMRRLWKAPRSKVWWLSLPITTLFYLGVLALYLQTVRRPGFNDAPGLGGLSRFGIIALGMVMLASTYTLRRRFLRFLPGKAQDWLWVHNWLGIAAVLIAMFHANFDHLLRDYCFSSQCLLNEHFGPFALYALIFLVGCGVFGRLFDQRLTRIIAQEASSNGVGIVQALEARVLEFAIP